VDIDLSKYMRDDSSRKQRPSAREYVLYNKWGKAVFRLRENLVRDFRGRPRGFVVGTTVYDIRGEHRGFWHELIVSDRMRRVIGFAPGASIKGLALPLVEFPPLVYRDQPAPELPEALTEAEFQGAVAVWSMMQLENLLPSFEEDEEMDDEEEEIL
jgi:hypothetical protein